MQQQNVPPTCGAERGACHAEVALLAAQGGFCPPLPGGYNDCGAEEEELFFRSVVARGRHLSIT